MGNAESQGAISVQSSYRTSPCDDGVNEKLIQQMTYEELLAEAENGVPPDQEECAAEKRRILHMLCVAQSKTFASSEMQKKVMLLKLALTNWQVFKETDHVKAVDLAFSIPPQLRAHAWKVMSGGESLKQSQSPDVYRKLLQMPIDKKVERYIVVDLPRTFVLHSAFERTTAFRKSLYNILKSYAVLDPALGYCQGMSFIVAFLFQILNEEDTFWVFASAMQKHSLSGIYKGELSLLQFFLYCTDRLIEKHLPRLFSHFKEVSFTPTLFASQWFSTLFTNDFPLDVAVKIWDVFLVEGTEWILKVVIGILKCLYSKLLEMTFEQLASSLREEARKIKADSLIAAARSVGISGEELRKYKDEFYHPSMTCIKLYL